LQSTRRAVHAALLSVSSISTDSSNSSGYNKGNSRWIPWISIGWCSPGWLCVRCMGSPFEDWPGASSIMVAAKFLDDFYYSNEFWAKVRYT
jgi:hypothetical protein